MRSARIVGASKPLVVEDAENPVPRGEQVLVKVSATGVCHSDLHLWEGGYNLGDGTFMKVTDRGVKYPVTPGHEVTGEVAATGEDSGGYGIGEKVLVYPWVGCGKCPACDAGNENLCDAPRSLGVFQNGGYADHILVPHHKYLARLDGLDPEEATSLACSALTAYTAIKKANANSPETLLIIGAGGLGLMGVQIARATTNATVICIDLDEAKLAMARKLGAHRTIISGKGAAERIMEMTGGLGVDSVVDFVNASATAKTGLDVLRKRGKLVLVGLFGGSLNLSLVTIPLKSVTIQGAYTGNYADMVELMGLARDGVIRSVISKRYGLEASNDALEDLRAHKIVGRAVINP